MTTRAVVYARLSKANEKSVSIARQRAAGEQYAAARGWQVVGIYEDDGVSATANRPEDRSGWQGVLAHPDPYDVVIIWKVDRLARRLTDFWATVAVLQDRGRALVAVEDNLDMTTAMGRTLAGLMAGFAEMEAEAIQARVTAARDHLVKTGRWPGGRLPYGWHAVPAPDGPGKVVAKDPERAEWVRQAALRVLGGATVYSTVQWLDEVGAPTPTGIDGWRYSTVDNLLRHPLLAGMMNHNPGHRARKRGQGVVRDQDGLPAVNPDLAVLTVKEWRALQTRLDDPSGSPQKRPMAMRGRSSALLSGLVRCGHCDRRMHRGTQGERSHYACPVCYQRVSHLEAYVVQQFLELKGPWERWSPVEEVHDGAAARLPEIEHALADLGRQLQETDDDETAERIQEDMARLRRLRRETRAQPVVVRLEEQRTTRTFAEDWADAETVDQQRAVLDDALDQVTVVRGRRGGHGLDTARVTLTWKQPAQVGAWEPPDTP